MRKIGYALIAVGFVAGALVAVLDEETIMWGYFSVALVVGAGGVLLVHLAQRQRQQAAETLGDGMRTVERSLARIVANVHELNGEKGALDTYEVRHRIDDAFAEDLKTFVDTRETIGHIHGLEAYADVMMHFAAGERYLNRVWSASADGYAEEVHTYLARAEEQFQKAHEQVKALGKSS